MKPDASSADAAILILNGGAEPGAELARQEIYRIKSEADVQARAALAGVSVTPIEDDRGQRVYIVSRWSLTKQCNTLEEVRALLARMGVQA